MASSIVSSWQTSSCSLSPSLPESCGSQAGGPEHLPGGAMPHSQAERKTQRPERWTVQIRRVIVYEVPVSARLPALCRKNVMGRLRESLERVSRRPSRRNRSRSRVSDRSGAAGNACADRIRTRFLAGQYSFSVEARLTRRWSRLAIASCGMVSLLAASCSTFSFHSPRAPTKDAISALPLSGDLNSDRH